jgi:aspartate/methionine/tyrosine aminotransferase
MDVAGVGGFDGHDRSADSFVPFALEAWQSEHEELVRFNLADSGVHPVRLRELLTTDGLVQGFLDADLHYPAVGGNLSLRQAIADLHPGATPDDVLVTVGASEANTVVAQALVSRGDHVVVLEPSYRQLWGTATNLGAEVDAFSLRADNGWRPDIDQLRAVLRPDTRLVCITNPNNPVGTIMTDAEIGAIVEACRAIGCWLLVDEVYRGSERLTDVETPTAFGRYDKVVATGSLSKAYGLSGLRIGWLVARRDLRDAAWRRHEYLAISTAKTSMHLAEIALAEPMRSWLLARTRSYIRDGWAVMEEWLDANGDLVSAHPPAATALAFVRYRLDAPSDEIALALRRADVLVGPGHAFGVEQHLRITHGLPPDHLREALAIIDRTLRCHTPRIS